MATKVHSPFISEYKSLKGASNPEKPLVYLSTFDDGAIACDPMHDRLLKLNLIALEMWKMLSSGHTEGEVADRLSSAYNVEKCRIHQDLQVFLKQLAENGLSPDSYLLTGTPDTPASSSSQFSFPWYAQIAQRSLRPRKGLVLKALIGLGLFDIVLSMQSFRSLLSSVESWPISKSEAGNEIKRMEEICAAVEQACVWYPKRAICLQRSAITAAMLRSAGIEAQLVIGLRPIPLLVHAWVEVNGAVVNDFPRVQQFYTKLNSF